VEIFVIVLLIVGALLFVFAIPPTSVRYNLVAAGLLAWIIAVIIEHIASHVALH
jgi:hypothetical protein